MERAIEEATELVAKEGYLHADDKSVTLAAYGYMLKEFRAMHVDQMEAINGKFPDAPKKGMPGIVEKAKMPGMFATFVALGEVIKAFIGF